MAMKEKEKTTITQQQEDEPPSSSPSEEEEYNDQDWDDWREEDEEEGGREGEESEPFLCLFCDTKFVSCSELFDHCRLSHSFHFGLVREALGLDFYGCFKLINYVRLQVAENRCWSCGATCSSKSDLQNHLHEAANLKVIEVLFNDDKYLKPFIQDDPLLYSFDEDEEDEEDTPVVDKESLIRDFGNIGILAECDDSQKNTVCSLDDIELNGMQDVASTSNCHVDMASSSMEVSNKKGANEHIKTSIQIPKDTKSRGSLLNLTAKDVKKVNEDYFGSYSSYGIHRDMLNDTVRMEAYRIAILGNPSLFTSATVMDVGCGTGILSLFAAKAGASRVIAVEASEKMAAVATQIVKDNGLWRSNSQTGVIEVFQGMVEEVEKIEPHSIDVLVSEWMGYCLLYESMLSSVLFARDKWLKPGGAILPDTATMFAAGFGRNSTSLPFWEDIYGFNMSYIGNELYRDAAKFPIVDVVDDNDLVTDAVVLQKFDLAVMKPDDVDFTANIELEPKQGSSTWCYGIVLWFDAGFTSRYCKEAPANLSTSPYTTKTHWSQTILIFNEPIAMAHLSPKESGAIGTPSCPAQRLKLRVSIARAIQHRNIDISVETAGIGPAGRKRSWPAQLFNLS